MRKDKIAGMIIISSIFFFAVIAPAREAHAAIWGAEKKSKLDKESYEKLVTKNLELRDQLEALVKEEDQLRDIYKVLLEKVKTFQRDNATLEKDLSDSRKISSEQAEKMKAQEERIKALEKKLKLTPKDAEPYTDAEELKSSDAAASVRAEINKRAAKRKAKKEEIGLLRKDMEKAAADKKALRDKAAASEGDIKALKYSIANAENEIKAKNENAVAEEQKAKALQDSLNIAMREQKDAEASLRNSEGKASQIEDAMKKIRAAMLKNPTAKPRTTELNSLDAELKKANDEASSLRERAQGAEEKMRRLESAVNDMQNGSKTALAAEAASQKEKIKVLKKNIARAGAQESVYKKDLQHIEKNIKSMKVTEGILLAGLRADDKDITALKRIIGRQVTEIEATEGSSEEESSSSEDEVNALKEKNKELEEGLHLATQTAVDAQRNAALEKTLPDEMKRSMQKERLDMHYNLAVVYDTDSRYKDAEREYLKCLKIDPEDSGVHYNLGILYDDKLHDPRKAQFHYRQFLKFRPMGEEAMRVRRWLMRSELKERIGEEVR